MNAVNWSSTLAVFDLETTGIDVETSRIVTANVSVIDADGAVLERSDWLLNPGVEIPAGASAVHGISTARAQADGMPAGEGVGQIVERLRALFERGLPVVAYNAPYDFTILNREALRHGLAALGSPGPIIDPLVIDKAVDRYRKGKRTLEAAAAFYGVPLEDAHDAGADAIAAGRVAQAIAREHGAGLPESATEMHDKQVGWAADQAASFQKYMRANRDPEFTADGSWPER
ncbi:exonuclease domain-containing protein [Microterricola viridarii]|uniref:DNA polymerase-3 subunit epsilon n=1 Tax=Microterricola viridarii TaxID=412690 RepID=A0A1H1UK74_9MICO|nr:exonuclease domain-containing protein [Microterricola viridarii]SDS72875.1 DNA polymerase-3 subunit epsilon [Microterricola viridarii]